MSGYKSIAAEHGGDPGRMQDFIYTALDGATDQPYARTEALAAVAQAAAIALLAVQLGRLADAIERDAASLPFPAAPQS